MGANRIDFPAIGQTMIAPGQFLPGVLSHIVLHADQRSSLTSFKYKITSVNLRDTYHADIMTDKLEYVGLPWGEMVGKG